MRCHYAAIDFACRQKFHWRRQVFHHSQHRHFQAILGFHDHDDFEPSGFFSAAGTDVTGCAATAEQHDAIAEKQCCHDYTSFRRRGRRLKNVALAVISARSAGSRLLLLFRTAFGFIVDAHALLAPSTCCIYRRRLDSSAHIHPKLAPIIAIATFIFSDALSAATTTRLNFSFPRRLIDVGRTPRVCDSRFHYIHITG